MHKEGHIGISLLVFSPVAYVLYHLNFEGLAVVGAFVMIMFSMIPDQDLESNFLTHRGFTHTVWFAIIFGMLFAGVGLYVAQYGHYTLTQELGVVSFLFVIGFLTVATHILADALTPMGVRPFQPYDDTKYTLNLFRASDESANSLLFLAGFASFVFSTSVGMGFAEVSEMGRVGIGVVLFFVPSVLIWAIHKYGSDGGARVVWE